MAADAGRSSVDPAVSDGFASTRERFEALLGWASSEEAGALEHSEFEERLASDGREVLRCLFQNSLDLRIVREPRLDLVVGADGARRANVERAHERPLCRVAGAGGPGLNFVAFAGHCPRSSVDRAPDF